MYIFDFADLSTLTEENYRNFVSLYPERLQAFDESRLKKPIVMSVCGEMLARRLITDFTGVKSFAIFRDKNGKPYVNLPGCYFNISHSGNFAVAVVADSPCGVDIEEIRPATQRLIDRVCGEDEKIHLAKFDDPSEEFIRLWTVKESFLKMTGEGIGYGREPRVVNENMPNCNFYAKQINGSYKCTVCIGENL